MALAFEKGDIEGLGNFIKEGTMFDHSVDKIIPIILNSGGAKVKEGESDKSIDTTLCNVDIYCKD